MTKWFEDESEENVKDLEVLVDGSKMSDVLRALVTIARGKAEHVRTNWQDASLAKEWERTATRIEQCADKINL